MSSEYPEGSFIRWQSVTIGQLTYATNLIFGLVVAALGFQFSLLLNGKFGYAYASFQFVAATASIFVLLVSIG